MVFDVRMQEEYSRGKLLLRTFFGVLYIGVPHFFLLSIFGIAGSVLSFLGFSVTLFTGKYPESWFTFQVQLFRWSLRAQASLWNLRDEYPSFGLDGEMPGVTFDVPYPERWNQGMVALIGFLGWLYVAVPHLVCLFVRSIAQSFVSFIAFWIILFTGKWPERMFEFSVGTLRWSTRLNAHLSLLDMTYPPFSGRP